MTSSIKKTVAFFRSNSATKREAQSMLDYEDNNFAL